MGRILKNLPTKSTIVNPGTNLPFLRNQHVNPNKNKEKSINNKNTPLKISSLLQNKPEIPKGEITKNDLNTTLSLKNKNRISDENSLNDFIKKNNKIFLKSKNRFNEKTTNSVYRIVGENDSVFFIKPKDEEYSHFYSESELIRDTITTPQYGREVASYLLSKMLNLEGLVPATGLITDSNGSIGSCQLDVYRMKNKNIIENKRQLFPYNYKAWDTISNASNFVLFDYIQGCLDRHGGNLFLSNDGKNNQVILIDNGLSFPEHDHRIIPADQDGLFSHISEYFRTPSVNQKIDKDFLIAIGEFNDDIFKKSVEGLEIPEIAIEGVIGRINDIKSVIKSKYTKIINSDEFKKLSDESEKHKMITDGIYFDGNDLANIIYDKISTQKLYNKKHTEPYTFKTQKELLKEHINRT